MATPNPKQHVEEIRRKKFSIGGQPNPLTEDLHQAVRNLSAELYTKDVHFLMELIQNAEDNDYLDGVDPSLEFFITSRDITATGAPATLLMFNNEKGFFSKNIESICSVGRSTKKGDRARGYIGEKGIGFKSVFLITAQPYIFSNGYQIRFNEGPCSHCGLGYVVPEWVEDGSRTLSAIQNIYGPNSTLPTTTFILPLKPDKVEAVKQQLSSVHPEILLFLLKIKRLSVWEDNENPKLNTVNAIAITSETNFMSRKNIDAESYTLHLAAQENGDTVGSECSYYMWKQKFPVRQKNKVERRMEVEEWVLTLAFPHDQRVNRGMSSPGVYAFLPTEMVTSFPFIIQADFVLSSSRETILLDDRWNQGILDCVPAAFVSAFISLVKMTYDAPVSSLAPVFKFIPISDSSYQKFNVIKESIRTKLINEDIIPRETYMEQKFFHKPCEVGRIMPTFWDILKKARKAGVSLHNLSLHGKYILHSSFDRTEYPPILNFLGVGYVKTKWYSKCIQSSNLALGVPEDVYLELLLFIADNWCTKFHGSSIRDIPLLKYVDLNGHVSLCSINEAIPWKSKKIFIPKSEACAMWLIEWNKEFRCVVNHFFMPKSTRDAIGSFEKKKELVEWLVQHVNVEVVCVEDYAVLLKNQLNSDGKLVIMYTHFLYHSLLKGFLSAADLANLCDSMPLVDSYGCVTTKTNGVLVPHNDSKWAHLVGTNLWRNEGFIELGEDYLHPATFAGEHTPEKVLLEFLKSHVGALDIPHICAPNAGIPAVNSPLTKKNTFLLLAWIRNLISKRVRIPENFLASVKEGCWLRVTINGSHSYRPPLNSFFPSSSWGSLLQNGSLLVDIPLIDQVFYGDKINDYKEELKRIAVMFEFGDACEYIGKHLMSRAASITFCRGHVFSILNFIRYLRDKMLPPDHFIKSIMEVRWLRTSIGDKSPKGAVLFDQEWEFASQISDIPFIDQAFYGDEIFCFKEELKLLGVVVGLIGSQQVVVDYFKSPSCLTCLKAESFLLAVSCMHYLPSCEKPVAALKNAKCLKTNLGYKSPLECFLPDPEWGCLFQVFGGLPIIDSDYYGSSIFLYKNELERLGVVMEPKRAFEQFSQSFKKQASLNSVTKENVISFLSCYRKLIGTSLRFPEELKRCIREEKWLRTKLGDFRSPRDCILFGPQWEAIFPITTLPFIDDTDKFYGMEIHKYEAELKLMGVVVELEKGAEQVVSGLCLPHDPGHLTPASVLSLLQCVRILLDDSKCSFPEVFLKKLSGKWLKTTVGYRSPNECLLFDHKFELKQMDAPFIDESFYGSSLSNYTEELMKLGVSVDLGGGCRLLASHLHFHSDFDTIHRVYDFFQKVGWKPESESETAREIWIPHGCEKGFWANPQKCVLHDKDGLFGMHLNVLENHYDDKLLSFFSGAFGVGSNPAFEDYLRLWKTWEESGQQLSQAKCCAFWRYVVKCRSSVRVKELADHLLKLPVGSSSVEVLLSDKSDVFIGDNLELKDLFDQAATRPIFVWYPQQSCILLHRRDLLDLYRRIGVRTISESVQTEEVSLSNSQQLRQVHCQDFWIRKGLVRLILGFLAGPVVKMEGKERHEAVQSLLDVSVFETEEPISVRYTLTLSSGEILKVQATRFIRWDRKNSKLFTQKLDSTSGEKNRLVYATYFSQVIADGLLWQNEYQITLLSELIKLGFLVEFDEEAVGFLLKSKNLQVFTVDEEFLSAAFTKE